ncbi:DUF2632 domain-containing protein [Bifidobacterium longum]|nr:hypothetical protein DD707_00810 [Bifidobacterium longum subsp. longum]RHM01841.1 DUF2632 domain-containing protein [Bifidobacterium longum]
MHTIAYWIFVYALVTCITSSILATAHSNIPFISQYASTLSVPTQHYYLQLCVGGAWATSSRSSTGSTARTGPPRPSTEGSRPSGA